MKLKYIFLKVQPSKAPQLRLYNFDVEHTSRETYQNIWNILATDMSERNSRDKRVVSIIIILKNT